MACTSELEWLRTLVYNPKASLRATKCLSELLDPPGSKASGQCWVSMFSFFWQPSVPHNFMWWGPICRMLGATVLQDWSIFLALRAAYQELYMGESHKMHVTFLRGPKGRGCLWQHLTGTLVPHSGAGLTRYWAGAECVSLETHFGHRSHLCCFTLDFPGTVALVQTCWWSGNNTGVEPTLLKSHIQVRSWAISYTSANSVIRSFMVLHNPFQDAWISQKSKLLAKKVIVIKKSGLCLLMQISAH